MLQIADHPFEFLALDVALDAVCSYLSALTTELETTFYPALDMLTSEVHFPCFMNVNRQNLIPLIRIGL